MPKRNHRNGLDRTYPTVRTGSFQHISSPPPIPRDVEEESGALWRHYDPTSRPTDHGPVMMMKRKATHHFDFTADYHPFRGISSPPVNLRDVDSEDESGAFDWGHFAKGAAKAASDFLLKREEASDLLAREYE